MHTGNPNVPRPFANITLIQVELVSSFLWVVIFLVISAPSNSGRMEIKQKTQTESVVGLSVHVKRRDKNVSIGKRQSGAMKSKFPAASSLVSTTSNVFHTHW